jgi:thiol-disulfide isomerase/thioredoxin
MLLAMAGPLGLGGLTDVQAQDSAAERLDPPSLRWTKGHNILDVKIIPARGSHLAEAQPVRVVLDDGSYFRIRWAEPSLPESGALRLRLPRIAARNSDGWTLEVSGAVCTDDGSSCLPFEAQTRVPRGPRLSAPFAGSIPGPRPMLDTPPGPILTRPAADAPEGGIAVAFAQAAGRGAPLLVDFYARWCPPCERLKAEFLHAPQHQQLLDRFVLLPLDADTPASFALKERYAVGGYPTVLLLSPQGTELDRMEGWDGDSGLFAKRLEGVLANWEAGGELAPLDQARRLMAAGEAEAAWQVLTESEPEIATGLKGDREAIHLALEIAQAVAAPEFAELASLAAELAALPGAAAALAARAIKDLESRGADERAAKLRADYSLRIATALDSQIPISAQRGRGDASLNGLFTSDDAARLDDSAQAAYELALWEEAPGRSAQLMTEASLRMAAAIATAGNLLLPELPDGRRSLALPEHLVDPEATDALSEQTGRVHDLVFLLGKAQLPLVAETLLRRMAQLLPSEFTWHYKLAGLLIEEGRPAEAEGPLRLALGHSYGDNRLRAVRRLAELSAKLGREAEAIAMLNEALAASPPGQPGVRTHRYRRALEDLRDTLRSETKN